MSLIPYLAGIVDGEGSVGIFSTRKDQKALTIEVKMTEKVIIDLLQETFGGSITFRSRAKAHHKDQWRWKVVGSRAQKAYDQLLPHLRLKRL